MSIASIDSIKQWLNHVFASKNLSEIDVKLEGSTEKGDGFVGDVIFVQASGKNLQNKLEQFSLVLKCSKPCASGPNADMIKDFFSNEIFAYATIHPTFHRFQLSKSVKKLFSSTPKFYGEFVSEKVSILVLENLKQSGFELLPKQKSLSLEHIKRVLVEYGRYHAISVAMQDQQAEEFDRLTEKSCDNMGLVLNMMTVTCQAVIGYAAEQLTNLLDQNMLDKWLKGRDQVEYIVKEMRSKDCLKVLTHGDCWNNNFMFKQTKSKLEVSILDWQLTAFQSPILDISHFIFSCISPNDVQRMDEILDVYYQSFSSYLLELGSIPANMYSKMQFLNDWKQFSKYGVLMGTWMVKMVYIEADDLPDIASAAETNTDMNDEFHRELRDPTQYRERMISIVKYVVENDLFS